MICKRRKEKTYQKQLKNRSSLIPTKENTRLRLELPSTNSGSEETFHVTLSFTKTRQTMRKNQLTKPAADVLMKWDLAQNYDLALTNHSHNSPDQRIVY